MRILALILILTGCRSTPPTMSSDALAPEPSIALAWDYPVTFQIYASDDISRPLSNWPLVTNIIVTNFSCTFPATGAQRFFTMTASNANGISGYTAPVTNPIIAK